MWIPSVYRAKDDAWLSVTVITPLCSGKPRSKRRTANPPPPPAFFIAPRSSSTVLHCSKTIPKLNFHAKSHVCRWPFIAWFHHIHYHLKVFIPLQYYSLSSSSIPVLVVWLCKKARSSEWLKIWGTLCIRGRFRRLYSSL